MKKITLIIAAAIAALTWSTNAEAKRLHRNISSTQVEYDGRIVAHPAGCPRTRFCGCGVSVRAFGRPVRELFLARNWGKFPSASAGPGMVAWRSGHVVYIESVDASGNTVVYDPNSGGHRTRIHTRNLSGYRIVNPHAGKYALTEQPRFSNFQSY